MADIQPTKTLSYKTVDKLEIPLDVYLPKNADKVPILLWFHGGGLLQGHRSSLAPWMRNGVSKYGYACISADYRFAPQVHVKDILDDVKDCIAFIRNDLSKHVDKGAVDTSRLAVSGSSAGGYLSLLAGLYVKPKPNVILPIYPITDPLGWFFITPQPPPFGRDLPPRDELAKFLDPEADAVANNPTDPNIEESKRQNMYVRMMNDANLAKLFHLKSNEEAKPFRISRNIHEHGLPPTYVLHGDADTAVGVEQADEVVGAALGLGIDVEYERVHGQNHFLDTAPDYENEKFHSFMLKHLNSDGNTPSK